MSMEVGMLMIPAGGAHGQFRGVHTRAKLTLVSVLRTVEVEVVAGEVVRLTFDEGHVVSHATCRLTAVGRSTWRYSLLLLPAGLVVAL